MDAAALLSHIARGRTDLILDLLDREDWESLLETGQVPVCSWLVYYNDATGLRAVHRKAGRLPGVDLDTELNSAAFFGHWKVCDVLIGFGADARKPMAGTGETPLHSALCKAGQPWRGHTVRLLLEHGADPNARTIPGVETGGFMRDVRTKGETPLHRAAAFADAGIIELLLAHGADREARDANGDSPLSWASWHLRPGRVLQLLAFPPHRVTDRHAGMNTADHGDGWGNAMDRNLLGDYLPLSKAPED